MADPRQRALVMAWFQEATAGVPPQRRAWARRGWFATARAWIEEPLQRHDVHREGPFTQLRTWERSCVVRIPTTGGLVYFKALPAMFAHEIGVVEVLARYYPHNVVDMLAVEHEQHWLLMADMGSQGLNQVADLDRWEEALGLFAHMQITSSHLAQQLLVLGCPDRRIETLSEQIEPFLGALPHYPGLSREDITELDSLVPALKEAAAQLSAGWSAGAAQWRRQVPAEMILGGRTSRPPVTTGLDKARIPCMR